MATSWFAFRPSALTQIAVAVAALFAGAIYSSASIRPSAPAAHAQGCPIISGFVYYDRNENGLLDPGEPRLGGVPMALRNSGGTVVGTDTTDALGFYEFFSDSTANPPEQTLSFSETVPERITDWVATGSLPQFDPTLGILTRVEVTGSAEITSHIRAESLDNDPQTITATVSGEVSVALSSSYQLASTPNVDAGTFSAAPYDGNTNFNGPSGHDFGTHSATDSSTLIIADAGISFFAGSGTVPFSASAVATSRTTGGGNVHNEIATTASAAVDIDYHYLPHVCLNQGTYTIHEVAQPLGYGDHLETRGNSTPIPGTIGSDQISVTLTNTDLINNNFGEIKGSLSGFVYVDFSDDGIFDTTEPPIPGTTLTLTGTDAHGNAVSRTTTTNALGFYIFEELCTGTYMIQETQPPPGSMARTRSARRAAPSRTTSSSRSSSSPPSTASRTTSANSRRRPPRQAQRPQLRRRPRRTPRRRS